MNETKATYLNNRSARAAWLVSNCHSHNNREEFIERLSTILPVTKIGHCSWNKCPGSRLECLNDLTNSHPFYLSFENSLCRDYITEKYSLFIPRMIDYVYITFSKRKKNEN